MRYFVLASCGTVEIFDFLRLKVPVGIKTAKNTALVPCVFLRRDNFLPHLLRVYYFLAVL